MTPTQANHLHLKAHRCCTDIHKMFYGHSYDSSDYDQACEAIRDITTALFDSGHFGLLKSVTDRITSILTPADYVARTPHIRYDDLINHLQRFPLPPYAAQTFLMGDAYINSLVVDATLRSAMFDTALTESWNTILVTLAKEGDVESWMALSEGLFHGSSASSQRSGAILSIGAFLPGVISLHSDVLRHHLQGLLDENDREIRFESSTHSMDMITPDRETYRALMSIGHLEVAHAFMNVDMEDNAGPHKIQDYMHEFNWKPSMRMLQSLSRVRPTNKLDLATSTVLYLLTQDEVPEPVEFYQWPVTELAKILAYDGTIHDFGTLTFKPERVGMLIEAALRPLKIVDPHDALIQAGISETHAMMSGWVRDNRFGTDLGL